MRELNYIIILLGLGCLLVQGLGSWPWNPSTQSWYALVLGSLGRLTLGVGGLVVLFAVRVPRRRHPGGAAWATAISLAAWGCFLMEAPSVTSGTLLFLSVLVLFGLLCRWGVALPLILVHSVGLFLLVLAQGKTALATNLALVALMYLALWYLVGKILGEWFQQIDAYTQAQWAVKHLAKTSERLQSDLSLNEIKTKVSERSRMAREIHDTVGHTLTSVLIQLRTTKALHGDLNPQLDERLSQMEDQVRSSIQEVRNQVHNIRNDLADLQSWETKLATLARVFEETTGILVRVNIEDEVSIEDDEVGHNLYNILKESLTNSFRHGRANTVDLAMGLREGRLLMRISDDGRGDTGSAPGSGLKGMKERVEKMHGSIVWQTMEGKGFDIGIDIPLPHRAAP